MADGPPDADDGRNDEPPERGPRGGSGRRSPGDAEPPDGRKSDADRTPGDAEDRDFESEPSLSSILGADQAESGSRDLVPGSPSLENALFVAVGVVFTILVLYRAWTVFVG